MFARKKRVEMEINVALNEPLTNDSCTKIVIEIIKYILYQKQQIPFTYDMLVQSQENSQQTNKNWLFSFKNLSNTLNNISDRMSSQFFLEGCNVKEIAILLGATVYLPKIYIGIEFPSCILNSKLHKEYQHPSRRPLLQLMKSIMECEEFQKAMSVPLGITNMFVMLKKSDSNSMSHYFLPKPQYVPPKEIASCFKIKLHHDQVDVPCTCRSLVKIYQDSYESNCEDEDEVQYSQYNDSTESLYQWYQAEQTIKGFKFRP